MLPLLAGDHFKAAANRIPPDSLASDDPYPGCLAIIFEGYDLFIVDVRRDRFLGRSKVDADT